MLAMKAKTGRSFSVKYSRAHDCLIGTTVPSHVHLDLPYHVVWPQPLNKEENCVGMKSVQAYAQFDLNESHSGKPSYVAQRGGDTILRALGPEIRIRRKSEPTMNHRQLPPSISIPLLRLIRKPASADTEHLTITCLPGVLNRAIIRQMR